ncbi:MULTISPECIES: DUF397 domain-containing protein [unclassified Streptomyces]|uniref:DUF397 domain-containing protein n=1 Tax=unclassified Streptomyces TaxID=2593676 RepID=UPI0011E65690|nr:DUF397 domain-containing protein [Streptomyces sp. sk2.1]TXS71872.1 DUF397 domain-containing protein [Streptomyces sp. sk2.1]
MIAFCFRKSSYSEAHGECIEVAANVPGVVAVRDSKNPAGPVIVLGPAAWDAFRAGLGRAD